mmetsp:Transcript_31250/g.62532  ORF Transcript_31250/g.62532 Transcript_31250/m.62532 type:complete len:505 (-) Transcript_31250:412-1926(-)
MGKPKKDLTPAVVVARLRPFDESGKSGHSAGSDKEQADARKKLESWTEDTIKIQDDDQRQVLDFKLTNVIGPEVDQEGMFETSMIKSGLVPSFLEDKNVMFFAYGQTGSGKTHTMVGTKDSLSSATPVEGWGLFPRIVHHALEQMEKWKAEGAASKLTCSAVEFYCFGAFDLLTKPKIPVVVDKEASIFGCTSREFTSPADVAEFISYAYSNRYVNKTKMNDASSRGHTALVLNLHRIMPDDSYVKTTFSIIDLAGSERASKTGGERVSGNDALVKAMKLFNDGTPEKLDIGSQGWMINYELSSIATEILKASEMHRKGAKYSAQKSLSTQGTLYMTACCDGRALLGMVCALSQSPQHGFETWFTLNYGQQLTKLAAPLVPVKAIHKDEALKAAEKAAKDAQASLEKASPGTGKQMVIYGYKVGAAANCKETLEIIEWLVANQRGGGGGGGNVEGKGNGTNWEKVRENQAKGAINMPAADVEVKKRSLFRRLFGKKSKVTPAGN